MESYILKICTDCEEIEYLMLRIDAKISKLVTAIYNNRVYLTDRSVNRRLLQDLLYYRDIVEHLTYNSTYFEPEFTKTQIISQVKVKVEGVSINIPVKREFEFYNPGDNFRSIFRYRI
jgi:hypothetical protein